MSREISIKKIAHISVFSIIFLIIVLYVYFRSIDFIRGPVVHIESPKNGETVNEESIQISGKAENIAFITLNDGQIFVDENGVIDEKLMLSPGYNIIKVSVIDRYDRKKEEVIELIYKE